MAFNPSDRPEEVASRLKDSLKELDGNFIRTARHERIIGDEQWAWVVQFQNPSVREYIDSYVLKNSPRWLEQVAKHIMYFQQVHTLLAFCSSPNIALPNSFWLLMYQATKRAEFCSSGRLVNYAGKSHPLFNTNDGISLSDKTITILKILALAAIDDPYSRRVTSRLASTQGWAELFTDIPSDDSEAFAVKRLFKWVIKESSFTDSRKQGIAVAFRKALVEFLRSDDIWPTSLLAIKTLAECIPFTGDKLDKMEKAAFEAASHTTTETALNNLDAPEELGAEAEALKVVASICEFDCTHELTRFSDLAESLQENSQYSDDDGRDDYRYTESIQEDDIDALFSTLLDR